MAINANEMWSFNKFLNSHIYTIHILQTTLTGPFNNMYKGELKIQVFQTLIF